MSLPLWVAFDCETTGFLPDGRLIEIGAVIFREDGKIEGEFQKLIRPPGILPDFIIELAGITPDMVCNAGDATDILEQFLKWVPAGGILVAHNVGFDLAMIASEDRGWLEAWNQSCVDSLAVARRMGEFPNNRLETIAEILQCSHGMCPHRALDDAHVVRHLMSNAFSRGLHKQWPEIFAGSPVSKFFSGRQQ